MRPRHYSTGLTFTRFALETLTVGALGWGMIYCMFACGNAPTSLPVTWRGNLPSCPAGYSVWVGEARTPADRDVALCVK